MLGRSAGGLGDEKVKGHGLTIAPALLNQKQGLSGQRIGDVRFFCWS